MLKKPKQRHETVVNEILNSIFTGRLTTGTKLPTEIQLSRDMGVDRTTLRVALKQLESMQLLEIRQGDGIYVRDYMRYAGMDFLRALVLSQEEDGSGLVIDQFLFDELWEFWMIFLPETIKIAARKTSPMDIKSLMMMIEREKEYVNDMEKIIELELAQQDYIARTANNIVITLLFNSSQPLRKKMLEIIFTSISRDDILEHLELKILLLQEFSNGTLKSEFDGLSRFTRLLSVYQEKARKSLRDRKAG